VHLTVVDVRVHGAGGEMNERLAAGAATYGAITAACVAQPRCRSITMWGLTDDGSWLDGAAYDAVREAFAAR
jgi:GH35 family endo-1,4-beta-xylanase